MVIFQSKLIQSKHCYHDFYNYLLNITKQMKLTLRSWAVYRKDRAGSECFWHAAYLRTFAGNNARKQIGLLGPLHQSSENDCSHRDSINNSPLG
jgi:hypothetical protein